MSDVKSDNPWPRRFLEAGFFIVLVATAWTLDTFTKFAEAAHQGGVADPFVLYTHQATSAVVVLSLIPFVAWWLRIFPLHRGLLLRAVPGHLIGHALFAIAHYFLIIGLRAAIYPLFEHSFIFSDLWLQNLFVEYQKDFKIYFSAVGIIAAYRYYRSQEADPISTRPDRLIVQTGSGETIIRQEDIEYLEAARNYVVVGTAKKEYLVRETLSNLEKTLAPEQIIRTHRSYLANIDRIEEIRSTNSGGFEIQMQCGKRVPLSRSHRDSFRSIITQ